ncbi:MAG: hypothetical protein ACOY0T_32935 [Myxococcota bacterium]
MRRATLPWLVLLLVAACSLNPGPVLPDASNSGSGGVNTSSGAGQHMGGSSLDAGNGAGGRAAGGLSGAWPPGMSGAGGDANDEGTAGAGGEAGAVH